MQQADEAVLEDEKRQTTCGDSIVCTPDAVAKYLGVHRDLIWQWLEEGSMSGLRPTKYWHLVTADTDTWITDALAAQAERDGSK